MGRLDLPWQRGGNIVRPYATGRGGTRYTIYLGYVATLSRKTGRDRTRSDARYLMGDKFTVADAYLFTVLRWSSRIDIDLAKWPNLKAYVDRVAARPKVQEALKAEGLIK